MIQSKDDGDDGLGCDPLSLIVIFVILSWSLICGGIGWLVWLARLR